MKIEENEKINKYLDFSRELKNIWNMRVTVILVVIGAVPVDLKKKLGET